MAETIFFRENELKIIQEDAFKKCKKIDNNVKKEFDNINSLNYLYYQATISPFSNNIQSGIRNAKFILQETPYMAQASSTYSLEKIEDFTQTDSIFTSHNIFWLTAVVFVLILLIKLLKLKLRFVKYIYYLLLLLIVANLYNFYVGEPKNLEKIKESYNFEQYKKDAYQFFAKEKTFELSED